MSDDLYKMSREGSSAYGPIGFDSRPKEDRKHFPDGECDLAPYGGYFTTPAKHSVSPSLRIDCIKIAAGLPDAYSTADVIKNGDAIYREVTK